jgi:hypothetical protein
MEPGSENNRQAPEQSSGGSLLQQSKEYSFIDQYTPSEVAGNTKKSGDKKFIATIAILLIVLGASVAAFFVLGAASNTNKLWDRALQNTAIGYDQLIAYSKEQKDIKGGNLEADFEYKSADTDYDGKLETKYYEKNSSTKLDMGKAGSRIKLEMLTNISPVAKHPDVYAKINGLENINRIFGDQKRDINDTTNEYNDKWLVLDHTYLDEQSADSITTDSSLPVAGLPSRGDVISAAETVGKINREYLFTSDPAKAVFTVSESIGKEDLDGRQTQHYTVAYNI